MNGYHYGTANEAWRQVLHAILTDGVETSPRGMKTREARPLGMSFPMDYCVLSIKERKLSYKFMAAEAFWILSGSDKLSEIEPYLPKYREFSDDGEVLYGAYGPRFLDQIGHVISALKSDTDSRQAVLTLWRPNPEPSKDVPCTLSLTFLIRRGYFEVHVSMRSSDAWLGLPYDMFTFSMMGFRVLQALNEGQEEMILPGRLHWHAVSAHLYERDWKEAERVMALRGGTVHVPTTYYTNTAIMMGDLALTREGKHSVAHFNIVGD